MTDDRDDQFCTQNLQNFKLNAVLGFLTVKSSIFETKYL